jgi:hypothetical protein
LGLSIALVAAFASIATAGPRVSAATTGSIGLRLIDVPVDTQSDPRAQVYIVDHLAPGTVIHRRIEVTNSTNAVAHVALYSAAATIANGSFLGAAGRTPNELSTWTTISPNVSDIPAGGNVTATVNVIVPHDAAPDEQYGVVWAEVQTDPTSHGGITQVSRVGIRIYLSVGQGGPPAANFTITSLTAKRAANGQPIAIATVRNTGGRALDMNGTLQLTAGPGGLSAGPFPATLGTTLAIGDTEPVTIALDKRVPAGPWDAEITLRSGLIEHSARATITFPDTLGTPSTVKPSARFRWPFLATGLPILLLLSITAVFFVLRRQRKPHAG